VAAVLVQPFIMMRAFRDLWKHRELLYLLAQRDITIRYKQSVMGILWALLMPAIVVAAGLVTRIVISGGNQTAVSGVSSAIVKALPWTFFVTSLRFSTGSLTGNASLVSRLAFPKEVFPIAAVLACGFDFVVALAVCVPILAFTGIDSGLQMLWALPLIAILVFFTLGLSLLLAAGNLFFRDVRFIVEVMVSFAIFFTPVLFDIGMLGRYANVALFNPVAPLLEGLRASIVMGQAPDLGWIGYSLAVSLLTLSVGYWSFKRMEYLFAERV
jgi:lipopolysaccharide transport system permease protein